MSDESSLLNPIKVEASRSAGAKEGVDSANFSGDLLSGSLAFLRDIPLEITVELGRTGMTIGELFQLGPSSVLELSKASDEPLDVKVNGVLVARGEAVVVHDRFGVRLTSVVKPDRILDSLNQKG